MQLDPIFLTQFLAKAERIAVPAKTMLLHEGATAKEAFFIEQGCLRAWINDDGKDITAQFFFEQQMVLAIESFIKGQPGISTIETIEPCILHRLPKAAFMELINATPGFQGKMLDVLFQRLFAYQKLFLSRIRNNPEQRYKELLENHPDIIRRIPQHYIASYLGITPVSLSRIRNRR